MAPPQDQMFMEVGNRMIEDALRARLCDGLREPCEIKICDLDDVMYKLEVLPTDLATMKISISLPGWSSIRSLGGEDVLSTMYAGMAEPKAESRYDLTLKLALDAEDKESTLLKLSELKKNLMGAPFDKAFTAMQQKKSGGMAAMHIPWRRQEDVYIIPQADRVTVVYAVDFPEADERAFCKVFLMEFADAQRAANNAPPVNFTPDPPLELQGIKIRSPNVIGYLAFVIFPQHVEKGRQESCVSLLVGFRNYLHYHIKATKTYMHMRMRKRVKGLLQVLQRAIPEEEDKQMKTMSGKSFEKR